MGGKIRRENAKILAAGYSHSKRMLEYFSIFAYIILFIFNTVRISFFIKRTNLKMFSSYNLPTNITNDNYISKAAYSFITSTFAFRLLYAIFFAIILSDFMSGMAHWGFDSWGKPTTRFFGTFIRSFREHHVDQTAMTRHDFVETNGDNALAVFPLLLFIWGFTGIYFNPSPFPELSFNNYSINKTGDSSKYNVTSTSLSPSLVGNAFFFTLFYASVISHVFILALTLLIALTNQTHKMAHQPMSSLPSIIKFLMKYNLLLSKSRHRLHHFGEFNQAYCITTGWLNIVLDNIKFWRVMEFFVTALTGAKPRADDAKMRGEDDDVNKDNINKQTIINKNDDEEDEKRKKK